MSLFRCGVNASVLLNWANLVRAPAVTVQTRFYAARKGTREKRAKKKVKVEVEKVGFIPHNQRNLEKFLATRPKRKYDDSWRRTPVDDVYVQNFYRWRVYSVVEAVQNFREANHPEIYNRPDAKVQVHVELNMQGEKKTRFVENFSRVAPMPHKFDHGEQRTIMAFTKSPEDAERCIALGAGAAGGVELIKKIQDGAVGLHDFQYVLAHPVVMPELTSLRGMMRKKFPNIKVGTLTEDVPGAVERFATGVAYTAVKDEYEKDFGLIDTVIGDLTMDPKHLEENFKSLIEDVSIARPKRGGTFITRCLLLSPPSFEKFKVNHEIYVAKDKKPLPEPTEDEELEEKQAVAA